MLSHGKIARRTAAGLEKRKRCRRTFCIASFLRFRRAEALERRGKIIRQGRCQPYGQAGARVDKLQLPRVQALRAAAILLCPIQRVSEHRVADIGQVDTDLVCATGLKL